MGSDLVMAAVHRGDASSVVGLNLLLVGIACLAGAAYMAYLERVLAVILLVVVGIICLVLAL
jgi:hypothetical protein